jgi:CBS domain-containing protein
LETRVLTHSSFIRPDILFIITTITKTGNLSGVVSERDYITKIALLGRTSADTTVKQIATSSSKLITATLDESVEACMNKMLASDIRHLPLVNESGELKGMISIKDLVKTAIHEKEQMIKVISDFALGKGGHYGSE